MTGMSYEFIARHQGRAEPDDLAFPIEMLTDKPKVLAQQPYELRQVIRSPLKAAGVAHVLHPDDPRLAGWLRLSARATLAACQLAEPGRASLDVDLGAGPMTLPATVRTLVTPADVEVALYAALAVRDRALQDALAAVDLGTLRPGGVSVEPCVEYWANTVQALACGADAMGPLQRTADASNPAQYKPGSVFRAEVECLLRPLTMVSLALVQDAAAFNAALAEAVLAHKRYYGEVVFDPPEYQQNDPLGYIALGPLAFACIAHDKGWPVEVRSDYLPRSIIERTPQG